ncbi:2475_t:CDS:2 [Scutellospora calospora]|uniref:2475_t:CDS:1 n=1 Tax=Scutellospora calospora TaxID=85575 RepID=A0ACA9JYY5_9GLOM|nr:2475_t:CDS:2 [Scutellospora calospora]
MPTIAATLSFPGPDKVIDFDDATFLMKIETLPQPNHARVFFLDDDPLEECEKVPKGIICNDITNNISNPPMPGTQPEYFVVNLPNKYEFLYDGKKICTLVPEMKRYTIHNHNKTENVKKYEKHKRLNKAAETLLREMKRKNRQITLDNLEFLAQGLYAFQSKSQANFCDYIA